MGRRKQESVSTGRNKKHIRFQLRHEKGSMPLPPPHDDGSALSRALAEATRDDAEPGVWEVVEYEDVIYRVHRLDTPKLNVSVEVVRS